MDKEIDYDVDPFDTPPAKAEEKKPEPKEEPKVEAPKHKSYFLRKALAAGISADEANEMEPDELERAIRLSATQSAQQPEKKAEPKTEEEEEEDEFSALKDFDEDLVKVLGTNNKKLKGQIKEMATQLKTLVEREQKREEAAFAEKIDGIMMKSGVSVVGDKPWGEYPAGSPEHEARNQIFAAARVACRQNESFESALKRTLKLFQLPEAKAESKPEPKVEEDAIDKKLTTLKKQFEEGGVSKPIYRSDDLPGGRKAALQGIAKVLENAKSR